MCLQGEPCAHSVMQKGSFWFCNRNPSCNFFCSEDLSYFWAWGDVRPIAKPKCRHGFPCVIRKVKKEGINEDRFFFCCAQENSYKYFEWVPEEPYYDAKFFHPMIKQNEKHVKQYLTKDFINDLASLKI